MRLLFCLFPHYYSLCLVFRVLPSLLLLLTNRRSPGLLLTHSLAGVRFPRNTIEVLRTYLLQFFFIYYSFCVLFLIGIFILTNTVRTQVAKTGKSQLHFYLFVILLFLLLQLVSVRSENLQIQTLTTSAITSDPDTIVLTPPGGTA